MEKIVIPYEERQGKVVWPGNARIVVTANVAIEVWGRETIVKEPPNMVPPPIPGLPRGDLTMMTTVEYGLKIGIKRIMKVFEKYGMKTTVVTSGMAAECYPELLRELAEKGHEICAHSYDQSIMLSLLSREEQNKIIQKSASVLEKISGQRPCGWISPAARCDENTVELLAENDFLWHGDLQDDDLPYIVKVGDKRLVVVPYKLMGFSDFRLYVGDRRSPKEALDFLKWGFDAYYEEGKEGIPIIFPLGGLHPYATGRPENIIVLDQFIQYVKGHPDVWITRRRDIAEYWLKNYSAP